MEDGGQSPIKIIVLAFAFCPQEWDYPAFGFITPEGISIRS
jgi:hypothetical protein